MIRQAFDGLYQLGIKPVSNNTIVYRFDSIKNALKVLTNETIYFEDPKKFNDPFELHSGFFTLNFDNFQPWLDKQTLPIAEKMKLLELKDRDSKKLEEICFNFTEEYKSSHGIYCLSKIHKNLLMWSHYADKHKGVCFGFEFNPDLLVDKGISITSVQYTTNLNPVDFFNKPPLYHLIWLNTKSLCWEYENEIRMIKYNYVGIEHIDLANIKEIYFGASSEPNDIARIKKIVSDKKLKVRLHKYDLSNDSYELVLKEID